MQSSVGQTGGVPLFSQVLPSLALSDSWRRAVPLTGLSSLFVKQRFGQNRAERHVCLFFLAIEPIEEKQNDDKFWETLLLSLIQMKMTFREPKVA